MNYLKTFLPYLFGNKKGESLGVFLPHPIPWETLNFEEILMFHALKNTLDDHITSIDLFTLSKKDLYQLFNFLPYLTSSLRVLIEEAYQNEYHFYLSAITSQALNTHDLQELLHFNNEELTLFAILKKDRRWPGVLVIRKSNGSFVRNEQNEIWSIPILGLSGRRLPFHHSNGCTPTGVFTIDSVMPEANNQFEFGQFRRLIVNFMSESSDNALTMKHFPVHHQKKSWWKPAVLAKDLGRSLLRIHGTGRTNFNPLTPYFPMYPTSGCLATNEAQFFGLKKYNHQRLLLDTLMEALNLPLTFENESKIRGLLYVVEFDDSLSALNFF